MNRKVGILLGVLTLFAVVFCIAYSATKDTKGPVITFGDQVPVYTGDKNDAMLLSNVTAIDSKDGDVSDSLFVDSVYVSTDGTRATATYVAMDSDHHVVKAYQHMKCKGAVEKSEFESAKKENEKTKEESKKTDSGKSSTQTGETEKPEDSQKKEDSQQEPADPKAPVISLNTNQVTIGVNDRFSYTSYIASMTDDEDDFATLSRRLRLTGDYQKYAAGTYEIHYLVSDTDGNKSNDVVLTLIRQ